MNDKQLAAAWIAKALERDALCKSAYAKNVAWDLLYFYDERISETRAEKVMELINREIDKLQEKYTGMAS